MNIVEASERLEQAEKTKVPIEPLTSSTTITVDDAYRIQLHQIEGKLAESQLVGMKIGLTSKVMQDMFQVDTPDFGHILNTMVYDNGGQIAKSQFISPKVEFELAFLLKDDLVGPNVTAEDVLAATATVAPAIEIIDSRIRDWKFRFEDTVADNGSSAGAIIGEALPVPSLEALAKIQLVAQKNGAEFDRGQSNAVMDNPANAVAWLANMLSAYDITLKAGQFILSGAITAAVPFEAGDRFDIDYGDYGQVSVTFTE